MLLVESDVCAGEGGAMPNKGEWAGYTAVSSR